MLSALLSFYSLWYLFSYLILSCNSFINTCLTVMAVFTRVLVNDSSCFVPTQLLTINLHYRTCFSIVSYTHNHTHAILKLSPMYRALLYSLIKIFRSLYSLVLTFYYWTIWNRVWIKDISFFPTTLSIYEYTYKYMLGSCYIKFFFFLKLNSNMKQFG